ncbi:4-hydroxythreonine-4-phosphate dehydrogenase [Caballeronia arvi]|uniref:4-hydroxythreonine-4-phosphate dehydrogenase n=1 Tax=Caballeronia arvi TaxID=1777135 RepID=A0A158KA31_9BURK|nr:4-hydroxythreonine-4-phosphate dehydrogenase PdxA [Caballeronia arvi]SAL77875.1 4-hydroxythreonine-4-phosphate dehydrogenase [Caballeronia arvi]
MNSSTTRPRIAVLLGDPAGIGPELIARLLSIDENRQRADLFLIGDRSEVDEGMRIAGVRFPYVESATFEAARFEPGVPVLMHFRGSAKASFDRALASGNNGAYSLDAFRVALKLTSSNDTQGMLFAPVNKTALHMAGMETGDEMEWFARQLDYRGPCSEFNVIEELWTSRVTSHVALRSVGDLITEEKIIAAIELITEGLRHAGVARPRIGVCGLNPHNGDNGSFGREELDVIAPAVVRAQSRGLPVEGPLPADTIFVRALRRGEFDGVVTMYHDQGQIAMKLMGFERGVTVHGGLPIPVTTPAHGTAFDIYGQGKAHVGATQHAFDIVCRMAASRIVCTAP